LRLAKAVSAAVSPGSPFGQEFRILAAKMRSMGESKALRVIGVVSATGGEGKTTISIGLAAAMSDPGRKVLLMECDLRKPAIEKYLGLERVEGLGEWLGGSGSIAPTRRVASLGFSLLSAGRSPANAELLGTDRMAHMLQSARRSFDWVVVDCPPLAPVADSVVLQDMLDGFLLVVRTRHTPIETIQRAVSHVKPERIQGIVVNGHRELLHSYYNYGYRYYGEID
jgi:capsular exopolysaccharide synthesis family protein